MVSFVLFYLQTSFSINFANKLIGKFPMSATVAIINAEIVFLDEEDHLWPPKNGGSEEWVGIIHNILLGERNKVSYFEWNTLWFMIQCIKNVQVHFINLFDMTKEE